MRASQRIRLVPKRTGVCEIETRTQEARGIGSRRVLNGIDFPIGGVRASINQKRLTDLELSGSLRLAQGAEAHSEL